MKIPTKRATRRLVASAALAISMSYAYSAETTCDIVIYGFSPAAISAAVQAGRMGKSAVVVSPETRIGGLTTGGEAEPINGTLKFYGAATLEAFKNASSAPVETTNLTDGDFSKSDTATATFPKGENKFFKAKIEE